MQLNQSTIYIINYLGNIGLHRKMDLKYKKFNGDSATTQPPTIRLIQVFTIFRH